MFLYKKSPPILLVTAIILLASSGFAGGDPVTDLIRTKSPLPFSPLPIQYAVDRIAFEAERGKAESQLYIGHFYVNGDQVEADFSEAAYWYRQAAEQGNARAQYALGFLLEAGIGVERDYGEAFAWYMKAAEQGDAAAHLAIAGYHFAFRRKYMQFYFGIYDDWRMKALILADIDSGDPSMEECFWPAYYRDQDYYPHERYILEELAEFSRAGDGDSTLLLARMVFHAQGVSRDVKLANELVQLAARQGSYSAAFILGAANKGNKLVEVPEEKEKRLSWLRQAAESTNEPYYSIYYHSMKASEAIYSLARGNPVLSADETAFHLDAVRKHAEKGDMYAVSRLGFILDWRPDTEEEGNRWLIQAAARGNYRASYRLGIKYLFGYGISQDMELGKKYLDAGIQSQNARVIENMSYFFARALRSTA